MKDALAKLDGAGVSTIHSFCQRLLTEHAFEHQRLFEQRLVDRREVFAQVFREYLRTTLAVDPDLRPLLEDHLSGHSHEEDEAVHGLQALMYEVVGFHGALAPKWDDEEVTSALAGLPRPLPTPEDFTGLVAANRVDKALRVARAVLDGLGRARDGAGVARMRALGVLNAWDGDTHVVEYLAGVLAKPLKGKVPSPASRKVVEIAAALAPRVPPADGLLAHLVRGPLQERLKARKAEQGLYDFDDMLGLVAESLRGPGGPTIVATLRARYEHVLIDEFQDTDPVQWEVFRTLFTGPGCPTSLIVIGDPKQAIYGFRAADVQTYLDARHHLSAAPVRLTQNFRSSARMIAAYNHVLEQQPAGRHSLFSATPDITYPREACVSCGDPTVRLVDAQGAEVPAVQLLRVPVRQKPRKDELLDPLRAFIVEEIARLLHPDQGLRLRDQRTPEGRALTAGDIYVLTRTNVEGQQIAQALTERGVPHAFYKVDGLFETPEAQDLVEVLEAIAAPHDQRTRLAAWLTPFFGLSPAEAERAAEVPVTHPLRASLQRWSDLAGRGDFPRLFAAILDDTGVARRAAFDPSRARALGNTQRLLDLLADEARRRHANLEDLVATLRAWQRGTARPPQQGADQQPSETDRPAVQLMTMHAAKGLEAAVVFLYGNVSAGKKIPVHAFRTATGERQAWVGQTTEDIDEREAAFDQGEDERLLYVALTRARVRMALPVYVVPGDEAAGLPPSAPTLSGGHDFLNRRLVDVLQAGVDPEQFKLIDLATGAAPDETSAEPDAPSPMELLAGWVPPPVLQAGAVPGEPNRWRLASSRRGVQMTSFTQLNRSQKTAATEVLKEEATGETTGAEASADELPTSATVGTFLHEALEGLDFAQTARFADQAAFEADPAVQAIVEPAADGAGIAKAQRAHAYRLLWAALRTPLHLGADGALPGLASVPRLMREVEFLYPLPEAGHRLLGHAAQDPRQPFRVERGFVKGFIDLAFEWNGRVYFADWKSSLLRDGSPAGLDAHMAAHYRLQVVVYGVAVLRLLGITTEADYERRFGGAAYLFLREMGKPSAEGLNRGAWLQRPSWREAQAWEQELLEHGFGREEGVA